jgi:hypothetical protein
MHRVAMPARMSLLSRNRLHAGYFKLLMYKIRLSICASFRMPL